MQNFELSEVIPKIDDRIAIWVSVPTSDDFNAWFSQFKISYMNFFYQLFEDALKKSKNEANKARLAEQLSERLRTLHPRISSVEVNAAEARKIKVASQKDQLDLYFRRVSTQFNSLASKFRSSRDRDEGALMDEVETLRQFTSDLKLQKNGRSLAFHAESFRASSKSCLTRIDDFFSRQEKSLTDFFNFFKTKNDRFKSACLSEEEGTFSEEEKKMATNYFESMGSQMSEIQTVLEKSHQATKARVESVHKSVVRDFEYSLRFHSIDAKFLDESLSIQAEFARKFDSLKLLNSHQQQEIQGALDEVGLILDQSSSIQACINHSNEINLILNCLEFLRAKILNRSIFLGQLKSDIQAGTTVFQVDLNDVKQAAEPSQLNDQQTMKKPSSKTKVKAKSKPSKGQSRKDEQDINNARKSDKSATFSMQIENLENDFLSRLSKISDDYYGQFKTRKFEITRPDEIPRVQNDYLTKINEFWSNLTNSKNSILNDSVLRFRFQVSSALNKAKEAEKIIYKIFTDFCLKKNDTELDLAYKSIEKELNGLQNERDKNRSMINLKMADENNFKQLELINEAEQKRAQNEKDFISKVRLKFFEIEKNCVKNFLNRLTYLTSISLSLFDKFVLIDDLVQGPAAENERRKTFKELKKNQIRLVNLNTTKINRPFVIREWPKIDSTLKAIAQFGESKEEENLANDLNEIDELRGNKRRKSKNEITDSAQSDQQKESQRPDSTKQSGRKQKESKNKKSKNIENNENEL